MPATIDPRAGMLAAASQHPSRPPEAQRGDRRILPERRAGHRLPETQEFSDSQFVRRTILVASLIIFTGLMLTMIWYASDVFLVLFAGILIAVLLRAPANWLLAHARIKENLALTLSIAMLVLAIFLLVYLFAVPMAEQVGQLLETLPRSMARMRQWMRQHGWAKPLQPLIDELSRMLISFNLDPQLAFYVLLLYVAIQTGENYLLTPLVEQKAISLPPALVIFGTLLLAALAGPLGVVLASPLIATCVVAVKLLYVEDVVEQPKPKAPE